MCSRVLTSAMKIHGQDMTQWISYNCILVWNTCLVNDLFGPAIFLGPFFANVHVTRFAIVELPPVALQIIVYYLIAKAFTKNCGILLVLLLFGLLVHEVLKDASCIGASGLWNVREEMGEVLALGAWWWLS